MATTRLRIVRCPFLSCSLAFLLPSSAILLLSTQLLAQKPSPAQGPPTLASVVPNGGQSGTTVEWTLTGTNLGDPVAAGTTIPTIIRLATDAISGKDSTKFRVTLDVPADAPLGFHRIWAATARGLSNPRTICVDPFPQIGPASGNRTKDKATAISPPCVAFGKVDAEASDYYRFSATAGQRLSFEVVGRRLGSTLDPLVRLYDAKGRELPRGYSEDAPGLQTDSRLTYVFAEAGEYLVEVRDAMHRGGSDYFYRLRIGDFPCAIAPIPLAAKRGAKVAVGFAGPQVDGVKALDVQLPTDPAIEAIPLTPVGPNGLPGWPVSLLVSDHDELLAAPSIETPAKAMRLPVPGGVTGRFLRKSQVDHFTVAVKKGQRIAIAAQTTELLSPAEVYLVVRDPAGKEVGKSDPNTAVARVEFQAAADGDHLIAVEHLHYAFGPNEVYRLTVTPPIPGFEMTLADDRLAVPQGQTGLIPVLTLTRTDFAGPVELSVVGPPGLTGTLTVAPGAQSGPPPGPGQTPGAPFAQLAVKAAVDLPPGVYQVKVRGKADVNGKELVAFASTRSLVSASLANLTVPPREWCRTVAVAVLPKPPFELSAAFDPPATVRGLATKLTVTAKRDAGFTGAIALVAQGLPANVTADAPTIPADKDSAEVTVKVSDKAIQGTFAFMVSGRAESEGQPVSAALVAPPLVVGPPFELKAEPNPLAVGQGETAKLTVTALRKGGYDGPIVLELRNLPANVSAKKVTIPKGQTSAEIALTAAANASLGAKGDVDVLGSVTLANQQHASPPFTLRVQPPTPTLIVKADPATLKIGEKAKFKVTLERKNLTGPAVITIDGLPAKVTAAALTIAADQSAGEVELAAAADAEPAKADATVKAVVGPVSATIKVAVTIEKKD
ncbi:MAG: PPC domain-containing protein [Gemmataceae bacterium]